MWCVHVPHNTNSAVVPFVDHYMITSPTSINININLYTRGCHTIVGQGWGKSFDDIISVNSEVCLDCGWYWRVWPWCPRCWPWCPSWRAAARRWPTGSTSPRRSSARPRSSWGPARRTLSWWSVKEAVYHPLCHQPWTGWKSYYKAFCKSDISDLGSAKTVSVAEKLDIMRRLWTWVSATIKMDKYWMETLVKCRSI